MTMLADPTAPAYALRGKGRCETCGHRERTDKVDARRQAICICAITGERAYCDDPACVQFIRSERLAKTQAIWDKRRWEAYRARKARTLRAQPGPRQEPPPKPAQSPQHCPRPGCGKLLYGRDLTCFTHGDMADTMPIRYGAEPMTTLVGSRRWA